MDDTSQFDPRAKLIGRLRAAKPQWYSSPGKPAREMVLIRAADRDAVCAEVEALRKDVERYRWLRDHPLWSVSYRIRPRSGTKEWRMRVEGEYWGQWWPTHEQAIDAAMKEKP